MHNNNYSRRTLKLLLRILPALFWILLIFGFDIPYIAVITLITAFIHEMSHIAATIFLKGGFRFGGAVSGLRLTPRGQLSYRDEILIAAAGPLSNFAVFLSTLPYIRTGGYVAEFGIISLLTGISNLLPIEGYDGYRILDCIASKFSFADRLSAALRRLSFALICIMTFLSLYFMKRLDGGYWIFFVFISILIKTVKKNQNIPFVRKREKKRDLKRF